ncbi:hypothetical protein PsorP6_017673 [Peronosclerospora sorghi]|uniref:Uncharacterized protein n=1 Tax=Peronosclerospora sorghi TaxID=230839 RepID=A0ACC0WLG9_9STRA|nr:hypothetical protein PsorP6_017673 [Peronosclerospora sorghi]
MTMEFAPANGCRADSTALSYAKKETKSDRGGHSRAGSPPPSLSFDSSTLFHFGSSADIFGPMKYSDQDLTAASSPTDSAELRASQDDGHADATAESVGPPSSLAPSNQDLHEIEDTSSVGEAATGSSSAGRTMEVKVAKVRSQMDALPSHTTRRKNSIEMFLSQSPSQALGEGFLKMNLDDRPMNLETTERAANSNHSVSGSGSSAARTVNSYASGQFQLNPVQESPSEYATLGRRYRHQQAPTPSQQPQDRYRSSRDVQAQHMSTALSLPRSNTVPGPNTTPCPAYSGAYALSPRMSLETSWSGNHVVENHTMYQKHMQDYYSKNQVPASYEQQPYRPHYQHQQLYRSPQTVHGSYGYCGTPSRAPMNPGQWNPMVVDPHLPSSMYDIGGGMYMNPRSSPMRHPHAHLGYSMQQQGSMGIRNGGHAKSRTPGRGMYSRMTPPLPESSPPHSPRKSTGGGMPLGMKQCKFFLQGHCRMGSKCKFVHQTGALSPEPKSTGPSSSRPNGAMMYQAGRMMLPPPPSHLMLQPQQRHPISGDDLGHQLSGPFGGRQQPRMNFRSENSGPSGMAVPLMNNGGMSAPMMGGAANDLLSAALTVEDIRNRVFAMSKDQNGCRLLQEQLDYEDRSDLCEVIYHESLEHLAEMMVDPFGNYLFQKLLDRVEEKKRLVIIRRVSSNLVAAALNLHGTRSVQKVVEVCATSSDAIEEEYGEEDEEYSFVDKCKEQLDGLEGRRTTKLPDLIVEALKDDAVRLCIDSNGNHVIQRALQFMKPEYNQFVFDAVCKECTTVGTHRHGCCVLQRCLDAANKAQKAEVIEQVERQAMKLMQDPYGNYVVQYVLDSCTAEEAFGVILKPLGHIYELSVQKFSSNVIEKCLEKAPERVRQKYIAEIINCPKMNKMLQDQFANYVVQRALCVCAEEQCLLLVKAIRPHLAGMKNTSGGRRITARILKRFPTMDVSLDLGLASEHLFETGGNGLMMGQLPMPSMGSYLPPQPLQPNQMYEAQGRPLHQFPGDNVGNRMLPLHGTDGNRMVLNDGGMNTTSRA